MSDPLELVFLLSAHQDLRRVYQFLAGPNLKPAKRAINAIRRDAELIASNPDLGRPVQDRALYREWIVRFGSAGYVMRYRVDGTSVLIARIWHSREKR